MRFLWFNRGHPIADRDAAFLDRLAIDTIVTPIFKCIIGSSTPDAGWNRSSSTPR
jgi:hypothetical protein